MRFGRYKMIKIKSGCCTQHPLFYKGGAKVERTLKENPHKRVVVGANPYGRRLMRTCDARPYGLYIRGGDVLFKIPRYKITKDIRNSFISEFRRVDSVTQIHRVI